ncbi:hypothetical protein THAOC_06656, partial [Thalassiosira oceanica]
KRGSRPVNLSDQAAKKSKPAAGSQTSKDIAVVSNLFTERDNKILALKTELESQKTLATCEKEKLEKKLDEETNEVARLRDELARTKTLEAENRRVKLLEAENARLRADNARLRTEANRNKCLAMVKQEKLDAAKDEKEDLIEVKEELTRTVLELIQAALQDDEEAQRAVENARTEPCMWPDCLRNARCKRNVLECGHVVCDECIAGLQHACTHEVKRTDTSRPYKLILSGGWAFGFLDSIDRTLQLLLDPPEMHTSRNSPLYSSLILLVPNMGDLPEASKSDSGENFRFPPLSALPSPQPSSSLSPRRSPASLDSGSGGTPGQGPASLFLGMVNTSGASRRGSCIAPRGGTPGRARSVNAVAPVAVPPGLGREPPESQSEGRPGAEPGLLDRGGVCELERVHRVSPPNADVGEGDVGSHARVLSQTVSFSVGGLSPLKSRHGLVPGRAELPGRRVPFVSESSSSFDASESPGATDLRLGSSEAFDGWLLVTLGRAPPSEPSLCLRSESWPVPADFAIRSES